MSPIVLRLGGWVDAQPWAPTHRATRVTVAGDRGEVMVREPHVANAGRELLARELDLLGRFSNPHLMHVLEVAQYSAGAALVLPRSHGLLELGVPPTEAARIGAQLADAVAEAHRCGVVHGKISLLSILRGDDGPIVDGFAIAHSDIEMIDYDDATWDYPRDAWTCLAPEQVDGVDPSAAADVWAVAMVVAALALGAPAVSAHYGFDALERIRELEFTRVDPSTPLGAILARVLVRDPALRPKPAELAAELARV
jgi:serine/threonine protein kinase